MANTGVYIATGKNVSAKSGPTIGGSAAPGIYTYLRPDGTSLYRRPDGTSIYLQPL